MNACITIRTLIVRNGQVYLQAGAGIVADSDPETEYQETVNKAMALLKTLDIHEQGKQFAVGGIV
jgi:anthranilate synthase component 1